MLLNEEQTKRLLEFIDLEKNEYIQGVDYDEENDKWSVEINNDIKNEWISYYPSFDERQKEYILEAKHKCWWCGDFIWEEEDESPRDDLCEHCYRYLLSRNEIYRNGKLR